MEPDRGELALLWFRAGVGESAKIDLTSVRFTTCGSKNRYT
jgi:hypothetical protein